MTEQLDPFRDPLIAVDNGGPLDAVEAWEEARDEWDPHQLSYAGNRLAAEVGRLRGMVAALEAQLSCVYNRHHCPDHKVIGKEHVECDRCGLVTWLPE
jgi:hypothetical protein